MLSKVNSKLKKSTQTSTQNSQSQLKTKKVNSNVNPKLTKWTQNSTQNVTSKVKVNSKHPVNLKTGFFSTLQANQTPSAIHNKGWYKHHSKLSICWHLPQLSYKHNKKWDFNKHFSPGLTPNRHKLPINLPKSNKRFKQVRLLLKPQTVNLGKGRKWETGLIAFAEIPGLDFRIYS